MHLFRNFFKHAQAGVQQDGMGPLATRLTLEEAEMLAARVGHVVRTAVSVDQNAVQEIKKDKDKKDPANHAQFSFANVFKNFRSVMYFCQLLLYLLFSTAPAALGGRR